MTEQTSMVRIDDALIRTADVSHMKWDRGHSYSKLNITMRDGTVYEVKDWIGSACKAEADILAGIRADELRAEPSRADIILEARFLCDRLRDFNPDAGDPAREFHGHVVPSLARLESLLEGIKHVG